MCAPCSLHLRAFPALQIVFCFNNGFAVYPRGDFGIQTQKATPPLFHFVITSILIVLGEKMKVKTHSAYSLSKKRSHRKPKSLPACPPVSSIPYYGYSLFFVTLCPCSPQTVVISQNLKCSSSRRPTLKRDSVLIISYCESSN